MTPSALVSGRAASEGSDGAIAYRIGFAVFILALLIRIAAIELTGAESVRFGDAPDYVNAANAICQQGIYPERGNLPFFRAPGLPFFIAAATLCQPEHTRAIKYALAACDALTVLLVVLLAGFFWRRATRDPRFAAAPFFAALLAMPHPLNVASVTDIRSEPLFTMLLTASIWFLLRQRVALSGVAVALAALTRPTALLCIPLFALFVFVDIRPDKGDDDEQGVHGSATKANRLRAALLFVFAAALTLAPWTARNAIRFGELIVVNDAAGFNLWRGTHRELFAIVKTEEPAEFARRQAEFEGVTVPAVARSVDARAVTPASRDREWRRLAVENVRSDPRFAIRATAEKALMYWRPWLHPAEHGAAAIALSVMVSLTLFLGGASGMAQFPDRRLLFASLLFLAAFWLAHVPYIPTIRLRMPFTDPLLMIFAAGALSAGMVRLRKNWKALLPLLAVVTVAIGAAVVATRLADLSALESAVLTIRAAGTSWWAVPLFVLLYALFAVLLLPVGFLSVTAAIAWGWKLGGALELLSCTLAAVVPYLLARKGLSGWIERRLSAEAVPALGSPFVLLLLRIVPVVPFVALNYIAGMVRVRPRHYVLTTFVGSIPSVFLFAWFVDTMAQGALGAATQAKIVTACVAVAVAAVLLRLMARRMTARPFERGEPGSAE